VLLCGIVSQDLKTPLTATDAIWAAWLPMWRSRNRDRTRNHCRGATNMLIQVLGTGCAKCKTLHEIVKKAVQETGIDAQVEKVEDIQKIMAFEILMMPGLVINGEVKTAGRVPSAEEIKKLIVEAKAA
jgi:small redox-active disulfide protein 2